MNIYPQQVIDTTTASIQSDQLNNTTAPYHGHKFHTISLQLSDIQIYTVIGALLFVIIVIAIMIMPTNRQKVCKYYSSICPWRLASSIRKHQIY